MNIKDNSVGSKIFDVINVIVLVIIGLLCLMPLWYVLCVSLSAKDAVNAGLVSFWPVGFNVDSYKKIVSEGAFFRAFWNSICRVVLGTLVSLGCILMAAYPLSRFKTKWGSRVSLGLLFMTALPASAMMISTYKLLVNFHMIDSLAGVILLMSAGGTPYAIWMMKNFMDTVSVDLEEAAWIDGASRAQATIHVLIPLMLPGFITVTTYNFISAWGNFYTPFIMLTTTSKMPASVNIYRLYGLHGEVIYGQVAAYSILYIIPIFVLYYFSQDHMSKGFSMGGAAKG